MEDICFIYLGKIYLKILFKKVFVLQIKALTKPLICYIVNKESNITSP